MMKHRFVATLYVAVVLIVAAVLLWLYNIRPRMSVSDSRHTYMTPLQIQSIRDIGQWESLAISDEVVVDTTRKGIFSDDHLVRIYYGTMRMGIDLSQFDEDAVATVGDTLVLTMPRVTLLDDDFIDETRTRPFHESGNWSAQDRARLYERARREMLSHGLTSDNLRIAEENAEAQMRKMLHAMGFERVRISFR